MASSFRRSDCRLCASERLTPVLSLTPTPPANAFVVPADLDQPQDVFPLDVYFCEACSHVQLLDVVNPEILFADYVYASGTSPVFVQHFKDYASYVAQRFVGVELKGLTLDIGSNDGTLLRQFKDLGMDVLGIDPAQDIAARATANGIETWSEFFTLDTAQRIVTNKQRARIITANNVFAHADDLRAIVEAIKKVLAPDGVFVFEVSYLSDVIEKTLFDTIYHEHLAYHSVKPLATFFQSQGMHLLAVERVSSHGGSLRGFVQFADGPFEGNRSVAEFISDEQSAGLHEAKTFQVFGDKINQVKAELLDILMGLKRQGKTLAGFGAPAKATTLMYHFGLGPDVFDFIIDDSPLKQGLLTPGLHIPVISSEALYTEPPDAVVILAWNFADPIRRNHTKYLKQGGRFIVPLPTIEIYEYE